MSEINENLIEHHRDTVFENCGVIKVNGARFERCTFKNVEVRYEGGEKYEFPLVGCTFHSGVVHVDGLAFENCVFERGVTCAFGGGPLPTLLGCTLNNRWVLDQEAGRGMRFLEMMYGVPNGGKDIVERTFESIRQASAVMKEDPGGGMLEDIHRPSRPKKPN